mmetsp:Transcript_9051/g.41153  ORF Transcript_9051/g.41153 Transcript_9051/m.41153 type:complete len:203 (+) Transcript_9051:320-928(+)
MLRPGRRGERRRAHGPGGDDPGLRQNPREHLRVLLPRPARFALRRRWPGQDLGQDPHLPGDDEHRRVPARRGSQQGPGRARDGRLRGRHVRGARRRRQKARHRPRPEASRRLQRLLHPRARGIRQAQREEELGRRVQGHLQYGHRRRLLRARHAGGQTRDGILRLARRSLAQILRGRPRTELHHVPRAFARVDRGPPQQPEE